MIMILGPIGGCGLGVGIAVGLDRLNPTFRRREEVEVMPGIHVLATIPQFFTLSPQISTMLKTGPGLAGDHSSRVPAVKVGAKVRPWASSGNGNEFTRASLNLVAKWQPRSIAAEQYRMAATKLVLSNEGRHSTVVEITSALMGEGKTTTVVNLGYTIARDFGKKTLLIDCDFQRPALHQYARVPMRAGLIEFLDGQASLDDCVSVIDECPCFILAAGGTAGDCNELGMIQQLKVILPELRAQFQYLIINAPPVLSSATMGILASLADELVWVIRAGHSPKHVVQKAFTMLGMTAQRQVILNGLDAQSMSHHQYGYIMPSGRDRSIESVRQ
jgi:capsular exopolysaccharide synthesis family protein